MAKLYPLIFNPIFKERIWGGRKLESLYGKPLPAGKTIGESWEISDRPGDASVIANGALRGQTLRGLMESQPAALLGQREPMPSRFPLLIKILDARETLSLQVHPPAALAAELGGEPKTEMWYVAEAAPGAELFAGLKAGVTRTQFEQALADQTVAECFHRLPVRRGDALFLPSGRVHALGGGTVIFEIQQNSDTTYRVFDWNRIDPGTGKGRELHVAQSLASIDFQDVEPPLLPAKTQEGRPGLILPLAKNALFEVNWRRLVEGEKWMVPTGEMRIIAVLAGEAHVGPEILRPGQFCLAPAECDPCPVLGAEMEFLEVGLGS